MCAGIRRPSTIRKLFWVVVSFAVLFGSRPVCAGDLPVAARKPKAANKPSTLRTYHFTAKIVYNGGVTPFKVGTKLTGELTYDLSAQNESKFERSGLYRSAKNRIAIRYGKLAFISHGSVSTNVLFHRRSEAISISASKLTLPKGWQAERGMFDGKDRSSMGVLLQNSPPGGVLSNTAMPKQLEFWKRFSSHTVGLNFVDGVRFPDGRVRKQAQVIAIIESLELSPPQKVDPKRKQ